MIPYKHKPLGILEHDTIQIASFLPTEMTNADMSTIRSFGDEWNKFQNFSDEDIELIAQDYFDILPESGLAHFIALDVGCGSGRWSYWLADKVRAIEAIDPSTSIITATRLLSAKTNVRTTHCDLDNIPFEDDSFDLVFSLGVLHHVPDTTAGLRQCVRKVKPGGFFLVYLYYNLDNRSTGYRILFQISNLFRRLVSKLPEPVKNTICDLIALFIYLPLTYLSRILSFANLHKLARRIPLSYYTKTSFYIMRNDARDRFGTPLEQRFSRAEIKSMMETAGLTDVKFSDQAPFWHAIGKKK